MTNEMFAPTCRFNHKSMVIAGNLGDTRFGTAKMWFGMKAGGGR